MNGGINHVATWVSDCVETAPWLSYFCDVSLLGGTEGDE